MSNLLSQIYLGLPAPLRAGAATLHGLRLRGWRYGPETDRLVEEALARESWSAERWRVWQEERVATLLERSATTVPYYREHWSQRRQRGDRASWELLSNWPVLEKDPVREHPHAFVADDRSTRQMFRVNTSGTSGKPLTLWRSRDTNRAYYALLEARLRVWNRVSRHDVSAVLGGQVVVSPSASRPPFWVWNGALNQLYLSANHVSRANAPAYLDALRHYRVTHLIAYASSAAALARELLGVGLRATGSLVVLTNSEPVHPDQRDVIERGLGAKVRETYGMVETAAGASECKAASLHLWPDAGFVEILSDDGPEPVVVGATGRLIATALLNPDMPLIRYAVGDRARLSTRRSCQCGRALPMLDGIEGRTNDTLLAPDGRIVYWLNPVFYGLPVSEAQIVQETRDTVRVIYVPATGFTSHAGQEIRSRLRKRMGDVSVELEPVERIPRGPNGKFKAVVNRVG